MNIGDFILIMALVYPSYLFGVLYTIPFFLLEFSTLCYQVLWIYEGDGYWRRKAQKEKGSKTYPTLIVFGSYLLFRLSLGWLLLDILKSICLWWRNGKTIDITTPTKTLDSFLFLPLYEHDERRCQEDKNVNIDLDSFMDWWCQLEVRLTFLFLVDLIIKKSKWSRMIASWHLSYSECCRHVVDKSWLSFSTFLMSWLFSLWTHILYFEMYR